MRILVQSGSVVLKHHAKPGIRRDGYNCASLRREVRRLDPSPTRVRARLRLPRHVQTCSQANSPVPLYFEEHPAAHLRY